MAGHSALLSIKPEYADKILSGAKKVEFRKRAFAHPVHFVLMYASKPIQRIVGYFLVAEIVRDAPGTLWKRYSSVGGIGRPAFDAYYAGRESGVAILIRDSAAFKRAIPLHEIGCKVAPQSYLYLRSSNKKWLPLEVY